VRRLLVLAPLVATLALAAATAPGVGESATRAATQECGHGIAQYVTGPELVFGRRPTVAAAQTLQKAVIKAGFVNAAIEEECSGWRVVVRGYDTFDTAVALQAEAARAKLRPTVECYQAPDKGGEFEVVLGYGRDLADAQALQRTASSRGFVGSKLESVACGGYEVILTGAKTREQAQALVQEAISVGFDARLEIS
jgi:tRNA(Phe) wybutosine-synthesizing methylase Tyw3